jgi:hypothetical protein
MAGLLGYALAGGLAGYGNSLVEDAKAKREAAMEELRNSRLMEREDRDRSFRREEGEANRAQQREMAGSDVYGEGGRIARANPITGEIKEYTQGGNPATGWSGSRSQSEMTDTTVATRIGQLNRDFDTAVREMNFDDPLVLVQSGIDRLESEKMPAADTERWAKSALRRIGRQAKADGQIEDLDAFIRKGEITLGYREPDDDAGPATQRPEAATQSTIPDEPPPSAPARSSAPASDRTSSQRSEVLKDVDSRESLLASGRITQAEADRARGRQDERLSRLGQSGVDQGNDVLRLPAGMTEEQVIEMARQAIPAKGKDAVRARLRQMGINPAKAGL